MTKSEFLDGLRIALSGKLSPSEIQSQVSYYDNYIMSEVRKGRLEEDVLKDLGDPRLIAKTIVSANMPDKIYIEEDFEDDDTGTHREFVITGIPAIILGLIVLGLIIWIVVKIAIFLMPVVLILVGIFAIAYLVKNLRE